MQHVSDLEGAPFVATARRGAYGATQEIELASGERMAAERIVAGFEEILPARFAIFDTGMRGDSLNIDLYGYDPEQAVAIVQIRHFFRRYQNGYANVHKDYVLIGRNEETKALFRHPVSAHAIHAAIRKDGTDPVAPIRAAQRWMWGVTDAQLMAGIRQGDILIVPARGRPAKAERTEAESVLVGGTHEVHAMAFCRDAKGIVYALGPTVRHTKGQHLAAYGDGDFWHSIRVGREADTWEWGKRLGD
ncbi:MAG: hypothetical protein KF849_15360 [Rhizobiaceae bacterium]|nr:hypothetical protein [Rhizobiaceae bacterium]